MKKKLETQARGCRFKTILTFQMFKEIAPNAHPFHDYMHGGFEGTTAVAQSPFFFSNTAFIPRSFSTFQSFSKV